MNCPSCRKGLPAGPNERCPFCGSRLSGPVEGALAPELAPTPDPRDALSPIREIPGLRKRERSWKDEVRERVRDRRERRSSDLPLFTAHEESAAEAPPEPAEEPPMRLADGDDPLLAEEPLLADEPPIDEPEPMLHSRLEASDESLGGAIESDLSGPSELGDPVADDDLLLHPAGLAEAEPPPSADVPPVERPARPVERLIAGAIDLAILGGLAAVVLYFASRLARVPLAGLWPAWPWLLAYLGGLGLLYAGYFTGTTGQTLGKMAQRLHVLHLSGGPPGHARALARALLGSLGLLLFGGGLVPMFFDPARRALHDRLLRTRVVRL